MVKIHLFTMVKDEVDIVEDWVKYHGKMFGYTNLFVIDNYSTDGTYEILENYKQSHGLYLIREKDYKMKGHYMRHLMKDHDKGRCCDIAYPLDIDEFICYYNNVNGHLDPNKTYDNITQLYNNNTNVQLFKTSYIATMVSSHDDIGHENGIKDIKYGIYDDSRKNLNKTFINNNRYNGQVDHGNHISTGQYKTTNIVLIHYHLRNKIQIEKKIINNVLGFGHKDDLDFLSNIIRYNRYLPGNHHITNRIKMLQGTYQYDFYFTPHKNTVNLELIGKYISE